MSRKNRKRRDAPARDSGRAPAGSGSNSISQATLIAGAALIAVAAILVFSPARHFQFIALDDPQYVSANSRVLEGLSVDGLKWAFTATSFYWHPLTWISHMLDVELFGPSPGAHHMMNVLLHASSSASLFLALAQMTRAIGASAAVALLFALHPLHVESVAWIAERKDALSTLFL
ncbi:MAG TPA: hypothetical protein VJL35_02440, partial [Gemmatimonadaceae bacterium]|nr:hypothetical protein [Gemmatimonadaceae bacterium]